MGKRALLHFCLAMLAIQASLSSVSAKSLRVGPGTAHASLAAGLAVADSGDTILVGPGVYLEKGLVAEKPVTLQGEGWPVLDAEGGITILDIRANGVRVSGLVFRNVGVNYLKEHGAIWITGAADVEVTGNRFEHVFFGVYGAQARRAVIRDNTFEGLRGKETANGNGLHFWKSDSITILGNHVAGHRDGIYLEFTGNCTVAENVCEGNVRYGLHFMYANGNYYRGNTFRGNGAGVAVMYSRRVDMRGNRFEKNWGASSYGLLLKSIRDSRIEDNRFERNTVAIFQEASSGLSLTGNAFIANGWALRIIADCDNNRFEANRFQGNTFDVAYNASPTNTNIFRRNSWDRYAGWDLDRDGLGDVPHRPVELFPAIMQEHPQAMALLRSHFVTLINVVERLFPTLSPASLEDAQPLMPRLSASRQVP